MSISVNQPVPLNRPLAEEHIEQSSSSRRILALISASPADLKRWSRTLTVENYDSVNRRFTKMIVGSRFRSSRGLLQTDADLKEAQRQYLEWLDRTREQALKCYSPSSSVPTVHSETVPKRQYLDRGMTKAVADFISFKVRKVTAGQVSVLNAHLTKFWLDHTRDLKADQVNTTKWEEIDIEIHKRMKSNKWSAKYAHDVIVSIRSFYRWMYDSERLDTIPRFVLSRNYTINVPPSLPKFFAKDELEKLFRASNERQRLWWLLCLNCGMTQKDLSDLSWEWATSPRERVSAIDLDAGTLTRRRGKHRNQTSHNIPTVVYALWPSVIKMLSVLPRNGNRVFSNQKGKPLVGANRHDAVAAQFEVIAGDVGIKKTVKHLRKTGVTLISTKFRTWRDVYLANSSKEVVDKNYDGTITLPPDVTEHLSAQLGTGVTGLFIQPDR